MPLRNFREFLRLTTGRFLRKWISSSCTYVKVLLNFVHSTQTIIRQVSMSSIKINYWINQLKHPLPTVRFNAVKSLGEIGSKDIVQYLLEVMNTDTSEGVRNAAKEILVELGYLAQTH
jgi:hypothetical protein